MSTPRDGEFGLPLVPPVGMRDFVYPESAERADVGRVLLETFARYGYDLVVTPPFEHQEVIERAMDDAARADLLRFVDPQTGDVAVLRADFTPQIARLIAAHFHDRPGPWRLAYRGTVIRRRRGRARKHRQVVQAGIECVGVGGPDGDIEALNLCTEACV
ncbi:MAG: ATP phosphoribosyltransferase regulatory subunit, partial [Myxococcales bacterium]|nr:ATP phosphoribosyltransferase regulatory subunit [Myxococcales bacterium]